MREIDRKSERGVRERKKEMRERKIRRERDGDNWEGETCWNEESVVGVRERRKGRAKKAEGREVGSREGRYRYNRGERGGDTEGWTCRSRRNTDKHTNRGR